MNGISKQNIKVALLIFLALFFVVFLILSFFAVKHYLHYKDMPKVDVSFLYGIGSNVYTYNLKNGKSIKADLKGNGFGFEPYKDGYIYCDFKNIIYYDNFTQKKHVLAPAGNFNIYAKYNLLFYLYENKLYKYDLEKLSEGLICGDVMSTQGMLKVSSHEFIFKNTSKEILKYNLIGGDILKISLRGCDYQTYCSLDNSIVCLKDLGGSFNVTYEFYSINKLAKIRELSLNASGHYFINIPDTGLFIYSKLRTVGIVEHIDMCMYDLSKGKTYILVKDGHYIGGIDVKK